MSYFTTHLSFTRLMKEFLRLVNIWRSYGQNRFFECVVYLIRLALLSSKMQISPAKLNNLCIIEKKLLLSVAMLTGRLMWVNYQEISNCYRPVFTYWLTDWRRQWLTDCWSRTAFWCVSFSLLWQLCTVGHRIFYMADVNIFLLVNKIMLISPDIYFKAVFEWLSLA